jgi:hypothetical protein
MHNQREYTEEKDNKRLKRVSDLILDRVLHHGSRYLGANINYKERRGHQVSVQVVYFTIGVLDSVLFNVFWTDVIFSKSSEIERK